MLVTFKSKAAAEVVMYEDHAKRVLDLLGKNVRQGVITAAETDGAIAAIEAEIHADKAAHTTEGSDVDHSLQNISLGTRMYPLLEMLRAASKTHKDVMWGV